MRHNNTCMCMHGKNLIKARGHCHWKVVRVCTAVMTPFFGGQSALPSLPISHQCANFFFLNAFSALLLAKFSALKIEAKFLLETSAAHPPKKVEYPPPPT